MPLKGVIFPAIRPQFVDDLYLYSSQLAFRNALEDRNFDFRVVIDNHFCTSCTNSESQFSDPGV